MKLLELVAVFLIGFVGYFTTNGLNIDFRLSTSLTQDDLNADEICATAGADGMTCSDCYNVVHCSKDEESKWVVQALGTCPSGKICKQGSCIISNKCPLPNMQFKCLTKGSFPDPAECTKYHVCVMDTTNQLVHFEGICENKNLYGYNPLTTYCGDKLVNEQCQTNYIPTCAANFQVGVVTVNPSLYYECKNYTDEQTGKISRYLYPYQRLCPNGKKFDLKTEKCV